MEVGCTSSCSDANWTTCYNWFQNVGTWHNGDGDWGEFATWRGRFFDSSSMVPKATQSLIKMRAAEIYSFDRIECLNGIWSRIKVAPCKMTAVNLSFPFWAGDKTSVSGTWQTMVFAMVSCLLICILFIPSIITVIIVVFCVGFVLIGILGSAYYLDLRLDSVTQILFIMGIGFAIDFAVHVSHAFLQAE